MFNTVPSEWLTQVAGLPKTVHLPCQATSSAASVVVTAEAATAAAISRLSSPNLYG